MLQSPGFGLPLQCQPKLQRPVKLQLTFKDVVDAEIISFLPGVERLNGTTVVFTARDMIEAVRFVEGALHPIQ